MGFLAPASFWFLSAIPLLLVFYFFKKQYETQTISSIYLWQRTLHEWESDRWWRKLQKNILLLLQLLILLFLIVALTRPFLAGEEVNGEHLVIVLDSSATMAAEQDGTTRLASAKQQATDLVKQLGDEQKVSIIHAQQSPSLLVSNQMDDKEALEAIDQLQVSYQHENLRDSVQLAQSLMQQGAGEIHIFTDQLTKERLQELDTASPIVVHNSQSSQENISLRTFGVKQTNNHVTALVTVKNEASQAKDVTLSISHDGNGLKQVTETIPANEQQTIRLRDLPVHDYYQAKIDDDIYSLDNRVYALLPKAQTPAIYLAGEVNPFVKQALLSADMQVTTVPKDENGDYSFPENKPASIYLLSGVKAKQWPAGPKLIMSPAAGGPFDVQAKESLNYRLKQVADDSMLAYSDVGNVYLKQAYPIGKWHGLAPLVKSGEQVVMAKGTYENAPMLLFAFDLDDSDWALQPGFPILLANSVTHLAGSGESLGYYQPMETTDINLSTTTEEAVMERLDGETVEDIPLNQQTVTMPSQPGIYQLHEKTATGSLYRYIVVQLDHDERTAVTSDSFTIDGWKQDEWEVQLSKQEIWRIFASVALFILFIEWEVYRRGIAG
ncbi:vWA domain-containing protein [Lentibacillus cibarius]|uniref:VWA domain-containing protein n=1 Tax=Lentibacillus cibarius TaxID=2583219 RepID=A0A5S3QNI8_9BACI|nr:BatA and WFA domain-containing protein [Lentibacillus cibarius]TMN23218.1 VWA domain-containing protein [Lentibacillus cibarius]